MPARPYLGSLSVASVVGNGAQHLAPAWRVFLETRKDDKKRYHKSTSLYNKFVNSWRPGAFTCTWQGQGAGRQDMHPTNQWKLANYIANASKIECCGCFSRQGGISLRLFHWEGIAPSTCFHFSSSAAQFPEEWTTLLLGCWMLVV